MEQQKHQSPNSLHWALYRFELQPAAFMCPLAVQSHGARSGFMRKTGSQRVGDSVGWGALAWAPANLTLVPALPPTCGAALGKCLSTPLG